MVNTPTTHYGLNKPANGDTGWDVTLNDNFDTIDSVLFAQSSQEYGLSWDESTDTYTRLGTLTEQPNGISPPDELMPIHANLRRCVLNDAGVRLYYTDPNNTYNKEGVAPSILGTDDAGTAYKVSDVGLFTLAESEYKGKYVHNITTDSYALITAKDTNDVLSIQDNIFSIGNTFEICTAGIGFGGDGQVMREKKKFYYRYSYAGTTHTWKISPVPKSGFIVHPDFVKNGVEVDYIYDSAYEGSMYDSSTGLMVPPGSITTNMYAAGDKLCSLSGEYPKTNEMRSEYRAMAANRGAGWRQQVYDSISSNQLLLLIEYASFYSQSVIGMGRTELSGGSWAADSYIGRTGKSNLDGNGTNSVGGNTNNAYMTWRGIENFFGNVWKWVDGININNNIPYVSNTDTDFADDTLTNYTDLGVTLINVDGWQNTLEQISRGFLPASVGASSSTKITDYYYQSTGWRVFRLGGTADAGALAGAFCAALHSASSNIYVSVGGRLAF